MWLTELRRRWLAVSPLCTLVLLLALLGTCRAADSGSSRTQIAKKGKAATGLVEVKGGLPQFPLVAYGSAFCIHPSGLFLTNEHVVHPRGMPVMRPGAVPGLEGMAPNGPDAGPEITLVLNPGQKIEKSYRARVVRSDKDLDLALLRVEGVKDLPALALGSDEGLEELMEVVAFGFPFGAGLATARPALDRRDYPAVSVNAGNVTSLRRREGELHRIQLDAQLNPGNSGGPVLDKNGKVVGVVVSGVVVGGFGRTGVNFAIPVSHVTRLLARPDVQFNPPQLDVTNLYKPVAFEARVISFTLSQGGTTVDLILKVGAGRERTHHMHADGETYRVTAAPVPPPPAPWTLRLLAQFDNATLNATTADRAFKVAGRDVKLSDVRGVHLGTTARVLLPDGKTVEGPVSGLEAVPVRLGEQTVAVNLTKAADLKLGPAAETDEVGCTLVVRQGGKEVFRESEALTIQGLLPAQHAGGKTFTYIDLQPKANQPLHTGVRNRDNDLTALPPGEQTLAGVRFKIGPRLIQLGRTYAPGTPERVEGIAVGRRFARLHILHATHQGAFPGALVGVYTVTYQDGTSATIPIRYGEDVLDWWYSDKSPKPTKAKVAWQGENGDARRSGVKIRLYVTTWDSANPDRVVKAIAFVRAPATRCAPFCVAMTIEGR
jgi:S1-C subfamily serine protease